MFTYNYSQPEDYRFSLDSIELAAFVAEQMKLRAAPGSVLDLCSGCGVIGFELTWHCPDLRHVDFVEVQEVYRDHFLENCRRVGRPELQLQLFNCNYRDLQGSEWSNKYSLIVCNPPYFMPGQGKFSPNDFKNRCRFYLDATFEDLLLAVANSLCPEGQAFLLVRDLSDHGFDLFARSQNLLEDKRCSVKKVGVIRGTDIFLIAKSKN